MELNIPNWITADFLKQSLESDNRYKDLSITDFTLSLAVPPGNNYGGLVVRVTMDCRLRGKDQKLSVIVKGPLADSALGDLLKEMKDREPLFYNVFLPEANKLSTYRFAPESFHSTIPSVVVMEDLREAGYLMADRIKQLDFDHCCLYMDAAAAFHASSIALYIQNPELIDSVCGDNYYADECIFKPFIENLNKWALECMAKNVSNIKISKLLMKSTKYIWSILAEMHQQHDNLNSLLQFDPWTTNMMFKYNSRGIVCGIKLLDFQNLMRGSPVHDLTFFIWSRANNDVRKYRLQDLYSHYLKQLNMHLRKLNCTEVDYDDFMNTIRMFGPMALTNAASSAFILDSSPADFNELVAKSMGDNVDTSYNPLERYYTQHFCQSLLPQLVDQLAAEGVFDYLEIKIKSMTKNTL